MDLLQKKSLLKSMLVKLFSVGVLIFSKFKHIYGKYVTFKLKPASILHMYTHFYFYFYLFTAVWLFITLNFLGFKIIQKNMGQNKIGLDIGIWESKMHSPRIEQSNGVWNLVLSIEFGIENYPFF